MALSAAKLRVRRGPEPAGTRFGYSVRAGARIWQGGLMALDSSGNAVPVGHANAAVFAGIAGSDLDNTGGGAASAGKVEALKGVYAITVPAATAANLNAAVYATDDDTATLTVGSNLKIGDLVGIEGGQTYVKILGS